MSDLDNFRQETKEWLDKNCPPTMRSGAPSNAPVDEVWGGKKAKYKNPESRYGWIEWVKKVGQCLQYLKNMEVVAFLKKK